jgi:bacillithiol biosynthesis deacetylase BshB1
LGVFFIFYLVTMATYSAYILAFGPHPDDVEVGAWGVLAQSSAQGKKNVIVDLTHSQLSTHGEVTTRLNEAQQAAAVLWITERKNLGLQDGSLSPDASTIALIVEQIRHYAPEIIVFPAHADRHPDHEATYQIVKKAIFFAGLQRYEASDLPTHKPRLTLCYQIWHEFTPDVTIALSDTYFAAKMAAFATYTSQEKTNGRWVEYLTARHITQGRRIGTRYGEGFIVPCHGVGVRDLDQVISGCF